MQTAHRRHPLLYITEVGNIIVVLSLSNTSEDGGLERERECESEVGKKLSVIVNRYKGVECK